MPTEGDSYPREARQRFLFLLFFTFIVWCVSSIVKETMPMRAVYVSLGFLFVLSAALIVLQSARRPPLLNHLKDDLIQAKEGSAAPKFVIPYLSKPKSGFGWSVTSGYVLLTAILFLLVNSSDWQTKFVKTTKFFAADEEFFYAVLAAPIYEELFFRGSFLYTTKSCFSRLLKTNHVDLWSIYLSSVIFWLFHAPINVEVWTNAIANGGIPLSPGSFLLGLVCGIITVKDKSLIFAIIFHMLANSLGMFWLEILQHQNLVELFYSVPRSAP